MKSWGYNPSPVIIDYVFEDTPNLIDIEVSQKVGNPAGSYV